MSGSERRITQNCRTVHHATVGAVIVNGVMLRLDDGWCAALDRDTMMCTIYERRPLICREFEMGAPECLEERQGIATAYR